MYDSKHRHLNLNTNAEKIMYINIKEQVLIYLIQFFNNKDVRIFLIMEFK